MSPEKQVLIIDDDSRNIFALKAVLKAKGIKCWSALDIHEGLGVLSEKGKVDAILLDIMMPEIDGYESIKIIKTYPAFAKIPIIAVTAKAMQGDKETILAAGADAYVAKPVDIDELMNYLNKYMN